MHLGFSKKFFLFLLLAVGLSGFLLFNQSRRAFNIVIRPNPEPLVSSAAYDIPIYPADPLFGNPGAPLTIIAFLDFGDGQSRALYRELRKEVAAHPAEARLVFKNLPSPGWFSSANVAAHAAAECANDQNKFWQFADWLVEAGSVSEKTLGLAASAINLDLEKWNGCRSRADAINNITDGALAAKAGLGIKSAPALFINNKKISLAEGLEVKQMIASFIAK